MEVRLHALLINAPDIVISFMPLYPWKEFMLPAEQRAM
jgi:hypothetical protein